MRKILFRAKRLFFGDWVYGSLTDTITRHRLTKQYCFIVDDDYDDHEEQEVDPSTVGQYTGLNDTNGKQIFEGDIVKGKDTLFVRPIFGYVDFRDASFCIVGDCMTHYRWIDYELKVIGNIFDNPELLEGGDK